MLAPSYAHSKPNTHEGQKETIRKKDWEYSPFDSLPSPYIPSLMMDSLPSPYIPSLMMDSLPSPYIPSLTLSLSPEV